MAGANVVELNAANWDQEVVQSSQPVLVDFWAPWCGPCRQLSPVIDRIATQFAGKVKVGKVNTDDSPDVAIKYCISAIPQVFLFKGGDQPKQKFVGFTPESELVKAITRVLET
jgi:thioredoxin 1